MMLRKLSLLVTFFLAQLFYLASSHAAAFIEGNLLVLKGATLYEYTTQGVLVQTIPVEGGGAIIQGVTFVSNGRAAIRTGSSIKLYNSVTAEWSTVTDTDFNASGSNGSYGKIGAFCNNIIMGDPAGNTVGMVILNVDTLAYEWNTSISTDSLSMGLDGYLYIGNSVYDPITFERVGFAPITTVPGYSSVSVRDRLRDASGQLYAAGYSPPLLMKVANDGTVTASIHVSTIPSATSLSNMDELDISLDGTMAFGDRSGNVIITDGDFSFTTVVNPGPSTSLGARVAFVQDNPGLNIHTLRSVAGNDVDFQLVTESCKRLLPGEVSDSIGQQAALISQSQLEVYLSGLSLDPVIAQDFMPNIGGIYNFKTTLINAGNSSTVVVPQQSPISTRAVYRVFKNDGGWRDFITDTNNSVSSAPGSAGICPPTGDTAYVNGLVQGNHCVQLVIQDGGANDSDSLTNKRVLHLGGVQQFTDTDGDGVRDDLDAFPNDPTETLDTDGDGVGDNADVFPNDATETVDTDGDGVGDNADVFPNDATETFDTDGDGVGDNADTFPNDATETTDTDGDGVGDNADAFPNDATETADTDGDGIGNNTDTDNDNDGVPDTSDAFPNDATETVDTDGDGVGDNADAFPNDATESVDTDGDGVGDNADLYPNDPSRTRVSIADYLPLNPGSSWTYTNSSTPAVLDSQINIAGRNIKPMHLPSGARFYFDVTTNEINLYGYYLPAVATQFGTFSTDTKFNNAVKLLIENMNNGQIINHSGSGSVNIQPTYGVNGLSYSGSTRYVGLESVTVPYGTVDAHHIDLSITTTSNVQGASVSIVLNMDLWFAKDVGIVRYQLPGETAQLVTASIAAVSTTSQPASTGGGGGGGCTLNRQAKFDPLFPFMLLVGFIYLWRRRENGSNEV